MLAILKKEISAFFHSPLGYLVIAVFLIINGLLLWVFKGDLNILDNGFADLSAFFYLTPWVYIFLISALGMRSFSDEKKQGTLELLLTKPLSITNLLLGKYFGVVLVSVFSLIASLIYCTTIYSLADPLAVIDFGNLIGAYIGLVFLIFNYSAIGIFTSTISSNQITAFILAVCICFFCFIGFESLSELIKTPTLEVLGIKVHYNGLSRGVLDSRAILYFICSSAFWLTLSWYFIKTQTKFTPLKSLIKKAVIIAIIFIGSQLLYKRADLTINKRYTISNEFKTLIKQANSPLQIDVFLKGNDFPSEFRHLQAETRYMLEELERTNPKITFHFINPLENETLKNKNIQNLTQRGLTPMQLSVKENGKITEAIIFPWALASYKGKTTKIPLIKNKIGANQQELVTQSVQQLEYVLADGFTKLLQPKQKKIAVLKGNGQLKDQFVYDFIKTLSNYYYIAPFTLDSVATSPVNTLKKLQEFDMALIAKPITPFTDSEKYVLDAFTTSGGNSLWLIDNVAIDQDSLKNAQGKTVATPRNLNLSDLFFSYGIRLNPVLINDLYSAPITVATGSANKSQFKQMPWVYSPLVQGDGSHPIVTNIDRVAFHFANQIDTLKNQLSKTILLKSSALSKRDGTPREISLQLTKNRPNPKQYTKGHYPLAVLLEGTFPSAFKSRLKPFKISEPINKKPAKLVVISDGDIIKNRITKQGPEPLGFNKWTGQTYGNKEFLLNVVNYLMGNNQLLKLRSKKLDIPFLNSAKVVKNKVQWQLINILVPLVIIGSFGFIYNIRRRKKYRH